MQTRCPACQTLYRIDADVLKRAGGQARCFRCDSVFDAYLHPVDDAGPEQADTLHDIDHEGAASRDSDPLSELSALNELPTVPSHSGLEPDSDLNLDELANDLRDLDSILIDEAPQHATDLAGATTTAAIDTTLGPQPSLDPPDERPDLRSDVPSLDETPVRPPTRQHSRLPTLLLGSVVLMLVLLALFQIAWFNRDQVLATPMGQGLAQGVCSLIGCELPVRRAASRYAVIQRNIGADPEHPGTLLMQVSFRNDADFAQPLPDIQLSFYDTDERLMARRRLHPDEYLFPAPATDTLVAPDDAVQAELRLEDPGRHASGFKLEFL